MTKTIIAAAAVLTTLFTACNEPKTLNMDQVHQLEDQVPAAVPTAATVNTKVTESKEIRLIVGVGSFYDASVADQQQAAVKLGAEALRIFGRENYLKGTLVLTKDLRTIGKDDQIPPDALTMDMKIDSLTKAVAP